MTKPFSLNVGESINTFWQSDSAMLVVRRFRMWKYYLVGIFASGISGLVITLISFLGGLIGLTLLSIPFGLLAGFIGGRLEKKYAKSTWGKVGFLLLALVMGIIFPAIPFFLIIMFGSALIVLILILEELNIHLLPDFMNSISFFSRLITIHILIT